MNLSAIHQATTNENNFFLNNQFSTKLKKIHEIADHTWSYLGKVIIFTRHLLNAASKNCHLISLLGKDLPQRIAKTILRLKLFSILSVPLSLASLKSTSEKIFKNFLINDKEGIALSSLTFTITAIDVLDSISTFVNTVLNLWSRPSIASLSALGLPFGFAMSGLGIVSRIIQVAKTHQVSKSVSDIRKEMLKTLLENKLGITEMQAITKTHLTEKSLKAIPGEIEFKLRELYGLISADRIQRFTVQEMNEISQLLDNIQAQLKKKFIIEGVGIFANTLIISALFLFCLGSLSATPFLILASSFFIRIFSLIYQDSTI